MKTLLLVDDDKVFAEVMGGALTKRGFQVEFAHNATDAVTLAQEINPEYCLVDLKMPGGSGLKLIPQLMEIDPHTKIVINTGYAQIDTAIEAIKLGAIHYLAKPVDADDVIEAFQKGQGNPDLEISANEKLETLEDSYILRIVAKNNGNISASARELGMHRRTLQRKLEKIS